MSLDWKTAAARSRERWLAAERRNEALREQLQRERTFRAGLAHDLADLDKDLTDVTNALFMLAADGQRVKNQLNQEATPRSSGRRRIDDALRAELSRALGALRMHGNGALGGAIGARQRLAACVARLKEGP